MTKSSVNRGLSMADYMNKKQPRSIFGSWLLFLSLIIVVLLKLKNLEASYRGMKMDNAFYSMQGMGNEKPFAFFVRMGASG